MFKLSEVTNQIKNYGREERYFIVIFHFLGCTKFKSSTMSKKSEVTDYWLFVLRTRRKLPT